MPAAGEIAHSGSDWEQAGGGGGVAAIQLAQLAGAATLYTSLGDDELGRRAREELESRGVRGLASTNREPQRGGVTHVDDGGERTITEGGRERRPPRDH